MNSKLMMLLIFLLTTLSVHAKDLAFEALWNKVSEEGLVLKSSAEAVEAAKINSSRAENHWYPNIYATGSAYFTNDPGANMFSLLSQRSITQSDFNPDSLNHPDAKLLTKGGLGLNLPLYEGGMKSSLSKASRLQLNSKQNEDSANLIKFYSEFAKNYFLLQSLMIQDNDYKKINNTLELIISNYKVGNKGNMIGHSGLLGLKSLKNRLLVLKGENTVKTEAYKKALSLLSHEEFVPKYYETEILYSNLQAYLSSAQLDYEETSTIKALEANALAANEIVDVEKSKNLPRIGLFAESSVFNGDRKMALAHTAGLYLNWNLFSGNDIGSSTQAIHNANAAKYYAQALSQKEKIEFISMKGSEEVLMKTLETLEDSQKMLNEQIKITRDLFQNGMINALQFVEVLSRHVDLLVSKFEVENKLIEIKATRINLSKLKPAILK